MLSENVLLESPSARDGVMTKIDELKAHDALSKAKGLVWSANCGVGLASTEQIAEYYEVGFEAVLSIHKRNIEEFEGDGVKVLTGKALKDASVRLNVSQRASKALAWTSKGALRCGLMLQRSIVAKQVRNVVLEMAFSNQAQVSSVDKSELEIVLEQTQNLAVAVKKLIEVERRQKQLELDIEYQSKRLSVLEDEQNIQQLKVERVELEQDIQQSKIDQIECEQDRYRDNCGHKYTILGYACKQGLEISLNTSKAKGIAASRRCKVLGIAPEKVYDPRFGYVGLYPESVLATVFGGASNE